MTETCKAWKAKEPGDYLIITREGSRFFAIHETYEFCKSFLNLPNLDDVTFKVYSKKGGCHGEASYFITPEKTYRVELNLSYDLDTVLETLIHELVHLEQYYENRLFEGEAFELIFDGNVYDWAWCYSKENEELPWEMEADLRSAINFFRVKANVIHYATKK